MLPSRDNDDDIDEDDGQLLLITLPAPQMLDNFNGLFREGGRGSSGESGGDSIIPQNSSIVGSLDRAGGGGI